MEKGNNPVLVAPSLLSADFSCLEREVRGLDAVVDAWHVDVMDGHFVPNITLGPFIVRAVRSVVTRPLDVHLMIGEPIKYAREFLSAGADILTAHVEAFGNEGEVKEFIALVKEMGRKVGLSLKPATPPEALEGYLADLDMVLVMTVEPGFGGQRFREDQLPKIGWFAQRFSGYLAVDGGINAETARLVREAGANFLVAGSYVFSARDRLKAIASLREG